MFSLAPRLRIMPALYCRICGQLMDAERAQDDSLIAVLFGAARYAICPICFQEVDEKQWTRGYKQKWSRWVKKLRRGGR